MHPPQQGAIYFKMSLVLRVIKSCWEELRKVIVGNEVEQQVECEALTFRSSVGRFMGEELENED